MQFWRFGVMASSTPSWPCLSCMDLDRLHGIPFMDPSTQHPETLWHATCQETTAISQKARQVSRWRTCPGLGIQPIGLSFDHLMIIWWSFDDHLMIIWWSFAIRWCPLFHALFHCSIGEDSTAPAVSRWNRNLIPISWHWISDNWMKKMLRLLRPHCVLCVLCLFYVFFSGPWYSTGIVCTGG